MKDNEESGNHSCIVLCLSSIIVSGTYGVAGRNEDDADHAYVEKDTAPHREIANNLAYQFQVGPPITLFLQYDAAERHVFVPFENITKKTTGMKFIIAWDALSLILQGVRFYCWRLEDTDFKVDLEEMQNEE